MSGFGHGEFGVTAADGEGADLVADGDTLRPLAEGRDPAGDFEARDLGGPFRRRILAFALLDVGPVHAGRHDLDEHLAGTGLGQRHRLESQDVRPTCSREPDLAHGLGQVWA